MKRILEKALKEMYRLLKPRGRLVLSDPLAEKKMLDSLKFDERLQAFCLSSPLYKKIITDIGFGTIEIHAKRPSRILRLGQYDTYQAIFIELVEVCVIKDLIVRFPLV